MCPCSGHLEIKLQPLAFEAGLLLANRRPLSRCDGGALYPAWSSRPADYELHLDVQLKLVRQGWASLSSRAAGDTPLRCSPRAGIQGLGIFELDGRWL